MGGCGWIRIVELQACICFLFASFFGASVWPTRSVDFCKALQVYRVIVACAADGLAEAATVG